MTSMDIAKRVFFRDGGVSVKQAVEIAKRMDIGDIREALSKESDINAIQNLSFLLAQKRKAEGLPAQDMAVVRTILENGNEIPKTILEFITSYSANGKYSEIWKEIPEKAKEAVCMVMLGVLDPGGEEAMELASYIFETEKKDTDGNRIFLFLREEFWSFFEETPFLDLKKLDMLREASPKFYIYPYRRALRNANFDIADLYSYIRKKSVTERASFALNKGIDDELAEHMVRKESSVQVLANIVLNTSIGEEVKTVALKKVLSKKRSPMIYGALSYALPAAKSESFAEALLLAVSDFLRENQKWNPDVSRVIENCRQMAAVSDCRASRMLMGVPAGYISHRDDPFRMFPLTKNVPLEEISENSRFKSFADIFRAEYLLKRAIRGCRKSLDMAMEIIDDAGGIAGLVDKSSSFVSDDFAMRLVVPALLSKNEKLVEMAKNEVHRISNDRNFSYAWKKFSVAGFLDELPFDDDETVSVFSILEKNGKMFSEAKRVLEGSYSCPASMLFGTLLLESGEI